MRKLIWAFMALLFAVSLNNCGGSTTDNNEDENNSSSGISDIGDLPQATSPVEDSSSENLSAARKMRLATTGMPMGDTDESDFSADSSLAACEMFNMTKQAIQSAAQGDLILCYVKNMFQAAVDAGLTDDNGNAVDIYDGNEHTFSLNLEGFDEGEGEGEEGPGGGGGGDGGPDHVKFTITKTGDVITAFEMFACSDGAQQEYLSQTISDTSFSMNSIGTHSDGGEDTTTHSTTVTGTLENGEFVNTKTIAMNFLGSFDGNDQFGLFTFEQASDSASMTGYMNGAFTDPEGNTGTFINQILGSVELLDANSDDGEYDINLLALGDGAVSGAWSGSSGDMAWGDTFIEGWNGDTRMQDDETAADFIADVESGTLPDEDEPTISFAGDQAYDCGGTPEVEINPVELMADVSSCSNLEVGHQWINCWQIIQQEMQ